MKPDINDLLEKYWEGETSLEDEHKLKEYFRNGDIHADHMPYKDMFDWMDQSSLIQYSTAVDMDILLEKYWEGETSIREEEILKAYFKSRNIDAHHQEFADLFQYFDDQKGIVYPSGEQNHIPKPSDTNDAKKVKIFPFRKLLYAVAAVSVLVFGAVSVMRLVEDNKKIDQTAHVIEIEDPEEALRVTKEALALVSSKFRESQQTVRKNMEPLEKAAIFK